MSHHLLLPAQHFPHQRDFQPVSVAGIYCHPHLTDKNALLTFQWFLCYLPIAVEAIDVVVGPGPPEVEADRVQV